MDFKKDKIFGFKRNVFFLSVVSLLNDFSNEMIQSVMPVFLSVTLGVPPVFVGMIEGFSDAVASFLKIFSGWFSDKVGKRKPIAIFGYGISVIIRPLYIFASSFPQILALRVTDRIGKGIREAPRDALLSESAGREELGRSFGFHRAMDAMGGIAGPLAAVLFISFLGFSYKILFLMAFIVGIFTVLTFVFVTEIKKPESAVRLPLSFKIFRDNPDFAVFLLGIFVFGLGTLPITLMLLRPVEIGASLGNIPLLYLIYSLAFVTSAVPFGRLSDKIGERYVIICGFFSAIACYLVLSLTDSVPMTILAFALFGIYAAATDGISRALASKLVPENILATGQGFLQAATGISSLLAGVVGGILWTVYNSAFAFLYAASFSVIGLIIFYSLTINGKHKKA